MILEVFNKKLIQYLFPDTFNLKETITTPVTKKPPLQAGKSRSRMSTKKVESGHFYSSKEDDDIYDSSVISSPGSSYRSDDEEWTIIDPKTDRKFIEDVRKKILQCVSNKTDTNYDTIQEENEDQEHIRALDDEIEFREAQIKALNDEMESLRVECGINVNHKDYEKDKSNSNEENAAEEFHETDDKEEYPSRKDITHFIRNASVFEDDNHQTAILHIVRNYIKDVKKKSVMKILDDYMKGDEDSDDAEDAIFLISEILSKKWKLSRSSGTPSALTKTTIITTKIIILKKI